MSFVYGGVDTADLPGVTATLTTWPSLGGLTVETTSVPGAEGVVYGGASRSSVPFTFTVDITGDSPAEIFDRRDHFVGIIDPSRGPRDLAVENEPNWIYPNVVVSSEIEWDRLVWLDGLGLVLTADVSFQTVGVASAREVDPTAYDATGVVEFTADRGNTASYPTIMLPSGGDLVIQINDFELQLNGTPDGLTAALDWDQFRFDLLDTAGNRVESLVPYMSHYDRPTIMPGQAVVARAGHLGYITYEWTGEPHKSASIKKINGVEVARNLIKNPRYQDNAAGWSPSGRADLEIVPRGDYFPTFSEALGNELLMVLRNTESDSSYYVETAGDFEPTVEGFTHLAFAAPMQGSGRVWVYFLDAGGSRVLPQIQTGIETYESGDWLIYSGEIPEGAVYADPYLGSLGSRGSQVVFGPMIMAAAHSESEALSLVEKYFDGNTPDRIELIPEPMVLYPNYRRI